MFRLRNPLQLYILAILFINLTSCVNVYTESATPVDKNPLIKTVSAVPQQITPTQSYLFLSTAPSQVQSSTPIYSTSTPPIGTKILTEHLLLPRNTVDVAFSPDSLSLALAVADSGTVILSPFDGKIKWSIPIEFTESSDWLECGMEPSSQAVAYSHDGSKLAIANNCGGIFLIDTTTKQVITKTNHSETVLDLIFSQSDNYVIAASCGDNGGLTIWNWQNQNVAKKNLGGECTLAEALEPETVIVGYSLRRLDLISLETAQLLIADQYLDSGSLSFAYSPENDMVAAETNKKVLLYNINTHTQLTWDDWQLYQSEIAGLAWSKKNILALVDYDGGIFLWDMSQKQVTGKIQTRFSEFVQNPLVFSPDGNYLITVFTNPPAIWDVSK